MSERFDIIAAQIADINVKTRELRVSNAQLQADNAAKTKLILDAQDRINELEARLALQSSGDTELAAVSASLAELLAELSPPADPAPVEPTPIESAPVEIVSAPVA